MPDLRLRPWREDDAPAFAALNADPLVMRHFPAPLGRAESDAALSRIMAHWAAHGFGVQAVELADGRFIGACGLSHTNFVAPFTPAVEIAWRFLPAFWGQGLAEAAARLALAEGFGQLGLEEVVAFTVPANRASWRLMQRLGMQEAGGFEHPRLPEGHPLRQHVLYRLGRAAWRSPQGA